MLILDYNFRCEATLGEFLRGIGKSPSKANYAGMINILIAHSHSPGRRMFSFTIRTVSVAHLDSLLQSLIKLMYESR